MPAKQHVVSLPPEDRATLVALTRTGVHAAAVIQRARVLLAADVGLSGPVLTDREVAAETGVCPRTVARLRAAWGVQGLTCIERKVRATPPVAPKLSTDQALRIAQVACTEPPDGFARWSLRLLAKRVVALEIVESIAPETIRQTLKKTVSPRGGLPAS
jgi:hypothetical protein